MRANRTPSLSSSQTITFYCKWQNKVPLLANTNLQGVYKTQAKSLFKRLELLKLYLINLEHMPKYALMFRICKNSNNPRNMHFHMRICIFKKILFLVIM